MNEYKSTLINYSAAGSRIESIILVLATSADEAIQKFKTYNKTGWITQPTKTGRTIEVKLNN